MQIIIAPLLPLLLSLIARIQCLSCPIHCQCASSIMDCKIHGLEGLPSAPSCKLEIVVIGNQTFRRTTLDQRALLPYQSSEHGGCVRLRLLKIQNCNIISVASNAFAKLGSQLEELDLSGNPLNTIEAHAFTGLRLKSLFLNNLQNPVIHDEAFSHLIEVQSLSLQNSRLTSLPLRPLIELASRHKLKSLSIKGNSISRLPPIFEPSFRLLSSFELGDNPWHCDCNLRWLIQLQKWNRWAKAPDTFAGSDGDSVSDIRQPTCTSPLDFSGYTFDDIIPNDSDLFPNDYFQNAVAKRRPLICVKPQVEHIEVDFHHPIARKELNNMARIVCRIRAEPDLLVSWFYHDSSGNARNVTELAKQQEDGHGLLYAPASSQIKRRVNQLSVQQVSETDIYSCQGQNILGNASVTVSIHWPQRKGEGTELILNKATVGQKLQSKDVSNIPTGSVSPAENSIVEKKFSLMDLIGAILGTFLVTMLVFVIAYRTSRLYVYRRTKLRSQSDQILRHHENAKPTPDGTSSSAASSSLMKFSQLQATNTPRNPPAYQNQGESGFSVMHKQRNSGTLTSHSTSSSQNVNGQGGAYETVYNETPNNRVMYETPGDSLTTAAVAAYHPNQQTFIFPFAQSTPLAGYPMMFGGPIPPQSTATAYALGVSSPTAPTYIPPPPTGLQPSLPRSILSHAGPLQHVYSSTMHVNDQCSSQGLSTSAQTSKPLSIATQHNHIT